VALSTADANKWASLMAREAWAPRSGATTPLSAPVCQEVRELRHQQRKLTKSQTERLVARYHEGATVYQLADEFRIQRQTVSKQLKKLGVSMRLQRPSDEVIAEMVRLYLSGMSLVTVGSQLRLSSGTVLRYIREQGIQTRDTHGRSR
jgi:DNA-binding CsgD family transcriptional regulator